MEGGSSGDLAGAASSGDTPIHEPEIPELPEEPKLPPGVLHMQEGGIVYKVRVGLMFEKPNAREMIALICIFIF